MIDNETFFQNQNSAKNRITTHILALFNIFTSVVSFYRSILF